VLSAYNTTCCISGLAHPAFLVASHIVPWRSDAKNRLNPRNGLCLSLLHDKAFDLGLLTIDIHHHVVLSPLLKEKNKQDVYLNTVLLSDEGKLLRLPDKFTPDPEFLDYHRQHIFKVA
jgi:putative restriction endonuclease